jgi:hypothetical protein
MIRLLIEEVLFEHVDLVVSEHAFFGNFAQGLDLGGERLVFIDFLHEPGILLLLGGVDALGPTLT